MKPAPLRMRRVGLALALAGVVAAAVAVSDLETTEAPVVVASTPKAKGPAPQLEKRRADGGETLLALASRRFDEEPAEVFRVLRPPPPPAPPKAVQSEERPAAPPLPFKYLGRLDEGETSAVLLGFQGQDVTVRAGETVGGRYRVEEIAAASVRFIYLPLNETQTLTIGERN